MTDNQFLIDLIKDMAIAHEMSHTEFCDNASWNETFQERYKAALAAMNMGDASSRKDEVVAKDDLVTSPTSFDTPCNPDGGLKREKRGGYSLQNCPVCNGNDADMPCVYPREHEKQKGCLRNARLQRREIPAVDDLVEQVAIAIYQVTHEGKWENRSNERRNRYRFAATQIISDINSVNKRVSVSLEKCAKAGFDAYKYPYDSKAVAKSVLYAAKEQGTQFDYVD